MATALPAHAAPSARATAPAAPAPGEMSSEATESITSPSGRSARFAWIGDRADLERFSITTAYRAGAQLRGRTNPHVDLARRVSALAEAPSAPAPRSEPRDILGRMREKELRLALVCFGGVSLAVYMHGVSKEILKLVRASRTLHAITDRAVRAAARPEDFIPSNDPEYDTEAVYFDLLREIGRHVELRVIVDVIAGASAGGINGVMLARALAHDLPVAHLRDMWLESGDVSELLAESRRARPWSKPFMSPFVWALGWSDYAGGVRDSEVRSKLSLFVRSRWFKPPLDGSKMSRLMFTAIDRMGDPADSAQSLLPTGLQLDLFVTLTDFYGYQRLIQIHDPAVILEREHRHVLHFRYGRYPSGESTSDFLRDNAAALAFAARATSAYPGAFPPAQIREVDAMLEAGGHAWPRRGEFIRNGFLD